MGSTVTIKYGILSHILAKDLIIMIMKKIKQLFCSHIIQIETKTISREKSIVSNSTIRCVHCDKHFTNTDIKSDYIGALQSIHMENLGTQKILSEMSVKGIYNDWIQKMRMNDEV